MRIPSECPECGGEIYTFILNGCDGFECKICDFMDVEDFEHMSSPEYEISITKALQEVVGKDGEWHKR